MIKRIVHEMKAEKIELGIRSVVGIVSTLVVITAFFYSQIAIPLREVEVKLTAIEQRLADSRITELDHSQKIHEIEDKLNNHIMSDRNK